MSQHPGLDDLDARHLLTRTLKDRVDDRFDDGYGAEPFPWPDAERMAADLIDRLDDAGYRITRTRP